MCSRFTCSIYCIYFIVFACLILPSFQVPQDETPEAEISAKKSKTPKEDDPIPKVSAEWDMSVLTIDESSSTMNPSTLKFDESKSIGAELSFISANNLCGEFIRMNQFTNGIINFIFIGVEPIENKFFQALYQSDCVKWVLQPCKGFAKVPFDPDCSFWIPMRDSSSLGPHCKNHSISIYKLPRSSAELNDEVPLPPDADADNGTLPNGPSSTENLDEETDTNLEEYPDDGFDTKFRRKRMAFEGVRLDGMEAATLCGTINMFQMSDTEDAGTAFEVTALKTDVISPLRCVFWQQFEDNWEAEMIPEDECDRRNKLRYHEVAHAFTPMDIADKVACRSVGEYITCGFHS